MSSQMDGDPSVPDIHSHSHVKQEDQQPEEPRGVHGDEAEFFFYLQDENAW